MFVFELSISDTGCKLFRACMNLIRPLVLPQKLRSHYPPTPSSFNGTGHRVFSLHLMTLLTKVSRWFPRFRLILSASENLVLSRCHQDGNTHHVHHSMATIKYFRKLVIRRIYVRIIQSEGISQSFAASSTAGDDRTQSAVIQHEMYIKV